MKNTFFIIATATLFSLNGFAQKNEIKAADKALKSGDSQSALSILKEAQIAINTASEEERAQYFSIKGNALLDLAAKSIDVRKNTIEAGKAFNETISSENITGKPKYSPQAILSLNDIKNKVLNFAVEEGDKKNFKESSAILYSLYEMDKSDQEKLYYAASYAVNAQDYDTALKEYNELIKLKYTGVKTIYWAKSIISDKEENFTSKVDRDKAVSFKTHSNPRNEVIPSKLGEIYKNVALIYVNKGKVEEAKKAITDARLTNPDDTSLISEEANLYLQTKDFATYKKLISEVLAKDPNNADLYYNLGVIAGNNKETADAENYYKKAIELNPKYTNAYLNLAVLRLDPDKEILAKMRKLGTSAADNKKYDELKKQREVLFQNAIPILEKAYELKPEDEAISTTLMNVYKALDMTDKAKALKAKLSK